MVDRFTFEAGRGDGLANTFEHPAVTRQRLRLKLTKAIDKLLHALDAIDGDPDLEDTDDDEQCDDEGAADPDLEPSLGSLGDNGSTSQASWAAGDRKASGEEREPDEDIEHVCERELDEDMEGAE